MLDRVMLKASPCSGSPNNCAETNICHFGDTRSTNARFADVDTDQRTTATGTQVATRIEKQLWLQSLKFC